MELLREWERISESVCLTTLKKIGRIWERCGGGEKGKEENESEGRESKCTSQVANE